MNMAREAEYHIAGNQHQIVKQMRKKANKHTRSSKCFMSTRPVSMKLLKTSSAGSLSSLVKTPLHSRRSHTGAACWKESSSNCLGASSPQRLSLTTWTAIPMQQQQQCSTTPMQHTTKRCMAKPKDNHARRRMCCSHAFHAAREARTLTTIFCTHIQHSLAHIYPTLRKHM